MMQTGTNRRRRGEVVILSGMFDSVLYTCLGQFHATRSVPDTFDIPSHQTVSR
jgi:hypothetical protein